jgi:hypothetical protein
MRLSSSFDDVIPHGIISQTICLAGVLPAAANITRRTSKDKVKVTKSSRTKLLGSTRGKEAVCLSQTSRIRTNKAVGPNQRCGPKLLK